MANPYATLGTLNKVRGQVQVVTIPGLNVSAPYLGPDMIRVGFTGAPTTVIPQALGVVQAPEPYLTATVRMQLMRTQGLADRWKKQMEITTLLGVVRVIPDAKSLSPWTFVNCSISGVEEMTINGTDASYVVMISGTYYINATMFAAL